MNGPPGGMQIGSTLRDARARAGLDIHAVEAQTKIRAKYLRALEDEQWDVLPSDAYAKGFLRTYAALVGLDGEVLVDEYRRQVEGRTGAPGTRREQFLPRRREPDTRAVTPIAVAVAIIAAVVIAALLVLGSSGDEDEGRRESRAGGKTEAPARGQDAGGGNGSEPATAGSTSLGLAIGSPVEVCLLDAAERELIDGQVLAAGTKEGPWRSKSFELRFPSGYEAAEVAVELNGRRERLPRQKGPATFRVTGGELRAARARSAEECP